MDSVKDRLKKVAKIVGEKSVKSMCDTIGVLYDTAGNWGKRNKIAPNGVLSIIEKYPQISKTYLETGTGDMLKLDSGISNYGHSDRANEVANAYEQMSNEDKEIFYSLAVKFRKDRESKLKAFDDAFEE